jgi:sterol desaturase/sphingolipid hydroxylase (fatty acid hydroxylase superfamily)
MILQKLKTGLTGDFLNPSGYFFVGWLLIYVLVAFAFGLREHRRKGKASFSIRDAWAFCFPRSAYGGDSAKLDYQLLFFCHYLLFVALGLFSAFSQEERIAAALSPYIQSAISPILDVPIPVTNGFWIDLIYTVAVCLARDLATMLQHLASHRFPFLWRFHQLHHSATGLNAFTLLRVHPVDRLTHILSGALGVGVVMGLFGTLFDYMPSLVLFANIALLFVVSRTFAIFRHSHVWIAFGPRLSRVLCSPAMHQIHHSIEERHHGKNFAHVFSIWDYFLGTLYVPKERETLQYGLDYEDPGNRKYDSFFENLLGPFLSDSFYQRWKDGDRVQVARVERPS